MKLHYYIIILILGSFYQYAHSEEKKILDKYTITARPIGLQSLEHATQSITILNNNLLDKKQAPTIGETLSNIPGVTTNRFSPLASRPIIRGLGGGRVLILENGVASLDVSTISADHPVTIDPIQAEQIEIFRGPSTLLYGSEASGGLINIVTNRIPEHVSGFNSKLYSSYNANSLEKLISFQTEGGYKKLAFHLDGNKRDAKNYTAKKGKINNSFYDSQNFNFGASYNDDWGFIGASYGRFDSTKGIPENPSEPDELPFIDLQQNRIDISGQVNHPFPGINAINLQAAYNDYEHTEFEDSVTPGTIFNNEQLSGRIEVQHIPLKILNGVIGIQFGYRNFGATGDEAFVPKTDSKSIAAFVLEEIDITDRLHFEIGGRFEHNQNKPDNANKIKHDAYSIASGMRWLPFEDIGFNINLSRSQRVPTIEELFSNGPHLATGTFELGQPTLEIETANNIDLSINYKKNQWKWNIALFANYIEDFIFLQGLDIDNDGNIEEVDETGTAPGELLLVNYQQNDVIFYGFETQLGVNLYSGKHGQLDLSLFGDYVKAQHKNGENLPRISPARIGGALNYKLNKFDAGVELTNIFAQNDNAPLETDTDGYSVLNINTNYDILAKKKLSVFLNVINLLNEDGRLHTSFIKDRTPIIGRSILVGLKTTF